VIAATRSLTPISSASSSMPLLVDHGRIHVGEEDLLAPAVSRLDDHVDRFRGERGA